MKTTAAGSEGQTGNQRAQNHQDPHNQTFQGHHIYSNQGANSQMCQEENQDFHNHHFHLNSGHRPASSQEWRDPYTPVQSRGDRSRYRRDEVLRVLEMQEVDPNKHLKSSEWKLIKGFWDNCPPEGLMELICAYIVGFRGLGSTICFEETSSSPHAFIRVLDTVLG